MYSTFSRTLPRSNIIRNDHGPLTEYIYIHEFRENVIFCSLSTLINLYKNEMLTINVNELSLFDIVMIYILYGISILP